MRTKRGARGSEGCRSPLGPALPDFRRRITSMPRFAEVSDAFERAFEATLFGRLALRLDQHHQRLGNDSVMCHRIRNWLRLHRGHDGIHVSNVHHQPDSARVLWIAKCSDLGGPERPEELLTLRG